MKMKMWWKKNKAKKTTYDESGMSPLQVAAEAGDLAAVKACLEKGAGVDDVLHPKDRTALLWASDRGHLAVVRCLLAHGAHVDASDKRHRTPLFYATRQRHFAIVQALMDAGATRLTTETKEMRAIRKFHDQHRRNKKVERNVQAVEDQIEACRAVMRPIEKEMGKTEGQTDPSYKVLWVQYEPILRQLEQLHGKRKKILANGKE